MFQVLPYSVHNFVFEMICLIMIPLLAVGSSDFTCEPDEYAMLVKQLKESGLVRDRRKGLSTHKSVFTGKEFVDWVVKTKQLGGSSVT